MESRNNEELMDFVLEEVMKKYSSGSSKFRKYEDWIKHKVWERNRKLICEGQRCNNKNRKLNDEEFKIFLRRCYCKDCFKEKCEYHYKSLMDELEERYREMDNQDQDQSELSEWESEYQQTEYGGGLIMMKKDGLVTKRIREIGNRKINLGNLVGNKLEGIKS